MTKYIDKKTEYIDKRRAIEILEEEHNGICVWEDDGDFYRGMMKGLQRAIALIRGLDPEVTEGEDCLKKGE